MRSRRSLTPDDYAQIIAWTKAGVSAVEQAERLGMAYANFCVLRHQMSKKGLLQLTPRRPWRPWTRKDLARLETLLEQGASYDTIAKKLKRTRVSIVLKCRRRNTRLLGIEGVSTAGGVAELLGIGCPKTITRWIELRWLPATNAGKEDRPLWRIQSEDLYAFLENPQTWMAWNPELITDPTLRAWAQELRAGKPQWLTPGQVAERFAVGVGAVNDWIHRGLLPSIKYGNRWINEADLVGFVPPCERPQQRRKRTDELAGHAMEVFA